MYPTGDSRTKRVLTLTLLTACVTLFTVYSYISNQESSHAEGSGIETVFGPLTGSEMAVYLQNLTDEQKESLPNYQEKLTNAVSIGDGPFVETGRIRRGEEMPTHESVEASTPTALKINHATVATP